MIRNIFLFPTLLILAVAEVIMPTSAEADRTLYTVSSQGNGGANLRAVNSLSGATIATIPITLSGFTVVGATGLARDPTTGKLWALLRVSGATRCQIDGGFIPQLVTINPATGVATNVGSAGDCFSGLAFSSSGTLYGVTGDGANDPEALYTFNKTNAARTLAKSLGNGNDGEAIGFNPNDGLIYHASGYDVFGLGPQIFESINPANLAAVPVDIPRSGFDYVEALALTYQGGSSFLLTDGAGATPRLLTITTSGFATSLGAMDHDAKGLAFTPKPPADFDGDVKNDVAVYQQSSGNWFAVLSTEGFASVLNFGGPGFIPVPGDYDGDGAVDTAVYETATGNWFVVGTTAGFFTPALNFGGSGYIPVPGDYDGDGIADAAVYQQSSGNWFVVGSTAGFFSPALNFGGSGFIPVPGDYDGDGKTDVAVYQQSSGNWFVVGSTAGFFSPALNFGGPGFVPVLPQVTILRALGLL